MINIFEVKAFPSRNQLIIVLDGIFMKSEIELAVYLAKSEILKLQPNYEVLLDIKNLKTSKDNFNKYLSKMNNIFKLLQS